MRTRIYVRIVLLGLMLLMVVGVAVAQNPQEDSVVFLPLVLRGYGCPAPISGPTIHDGAR